MDYSRLCQFNPEVVTALQKGLIIRTELHSSNWVKTATLHFGDIIPQVESDGLNPYHSDKAYFASN